MNLNTYIWFYRNHSLGELIEYILAIKQSWNLDTHIAYGAYEMMKFMFSSKMRKRMLSRIQHCSHCFWIRSFFGKTGVSSKGINNILRTLYHVSVCIYVGGMGHGVHGMISSFTWYKLWNLFNYKTTRILDWNEIQCI